VDNPQPRGIAHRPVLATSLQDPRDAWQRPAWAGTNLLRNSTDIVVVAG